MTTWMPLNAHRKTRPAPGDLIAHLHAVWRVTAVADLAWSAEDREMWMDIGAPDADKWRGRPYRIHTEHVAGARPDWASAEGPVQSSRLDVPGSRYGEHDWWVYPASGRWPMCSGCHEPMPCRADLEDREVTKTMNKVAEHMRKTPGNCWACDEPITKRQKFVLYVGDNLDLPGAAAPRFHTRSACRGWAERYELRWIAEDPRRERILTYPKCGGILVVHGDGSSECKSGPMVAGVHEGEPGCRGHLTHDHSAHQACYVGSSYLAPLADMPGCPRGCRRETHPGTRTTPRPARVPFAQITIGGAA